MFVLDLSDPLWRLLDDAHRDRDIPALLDRMARDWDAEAANGLFWDCLCHQDTCYGATYAAIPHLLRIAAAPPVPQATTDIAHFLGHVARVAFEPGGCCGDDAMPQGLPQSLEAWDKKRDAFRSLAQYARRDLSDPAWPETLAAAVRHRAQSRDYAKMRAVLEDMMPEAVEMSDQLFALPTRADRQAELDRYEELLARPAVSEPDLETISQIRDAFFAALEPIAALCKSCYLAATDPHERRHFLAGVLAAMGDRGLAELMEAGESGGFTCTACGTPHAFSVFDPKIACYVAPEVGRITGEDPQMLDWKDGAPNRAHGLVRPRAAFDPGTPGAAVLALAEAQGDAQNARLLKGLAGRYTCSVCGAEAGLTRV